MAIDTHLLKNLEGISAHDAIGMLCDDFGLGNAYITFTTTRNRAAIKSFISAIYLKDVDAKFVGPIEFWGGPPETKYYYTGTLLTLLCDAILNHWSKTGGYADLVQHEDD